jgi:hypothetical protein
MSFALVAADICSNIATDVKQEPLLDLDEPWRVLARSVEPLMAPRTDYEIDGFSETCYSHAARCARAASSSCTTVQRIHRWPTRKFRSTISTRTCI